MKRKCNPLSGGYSLATISANIEHMMRAGHKQVQAIAAALKQARESFRKRFPKKAFPAHLRKVNPDIHIDIGSHNTGGRNVRAKNPAKKAKRYFIVDQEQRGLWYQVAHFHDKPRAVKYAQFLADSSGHRIRVVHQFPSAHNVKPI